MKKSELKEEFFRYLAETPAPADKKVERLAERYRNAAAMKPPKRLWPKIQKQIAEQYAAAPTDEPGFGARLKALFSPPLMPALVLSVLGILVGAFILLREGSAPKREVPLVEIGAAATQEKGDILVARGMRIESVSGGAIQRIAGATDKIVLKTGAWQMALTHSELEKPVQFVFPGGALEPLGTAFSVKIGNESTEVYLSEGKIRLYERGEGKWLATEINAPFQGRLKPYPVETEIKTEEPAAQKQQQRPSKYSKYVGKAIAVELKNGDRLSGKLRSAKDGVLSLAGSAGNLRVRERDVVRVSRK